MIIVVRLSERAMEPFSESTAMAQKALFTQEAKMTTPFSLFEFVAPEAQIGFDARNVAR